MLTCSELQPPMGILLYWPCLCQGTTYGFISAARRATFTPSGHFRAREEKGPV
ncbi:rCG30626, partial [Rattus norvegicus]